MKGMGTECPSSKGYISEHYHYILSTTSIINPNLIPACHLHHKTTSFLAFSYLVNSRPWLRLIHSLMVSLVLSLQTPKKVCFLYQFRSGQLVISLHLGPGKALLCPAHKHSPLQTPAHCSVLGRGGLHSTAAPVNRPARIWILAACKPTGTGLWASPAQWVQQAWMWNKVRESCFLFPVLSPALESWKKGHF